MRRLLCLILAAVLCAPLPARNLAAFLGGRPPSAPPPGGSYLLSDDFSYANLAAAVSAGWSSGDTPTVGGGLATLDSSSDYLRSPSFTASSTVWLFFEVTISTNMSCQYLYIEDAANATVGEFRFRSSGAVRISHGSGTVTATSGTFPITGATKAYVWLRWVKHATAGEMDCYVSSTSTRPGSPTVSITNGTGNADVAYVRLGTSGAAVTIDCDKIRVAASELTDAGAIL